ncbi:hypothetical protein H8B02_01060 [Bradyrhizobium sp. Pear77]|uniref:hypothetical protein n=1 Tax=Bradyrhizobium altum TaxID=1571202 RepID=UPI001E441A6A|nr:hypothetical protein [Bradyrhizobium altum]MCC8952088.1 hypothetical protein [Bradyrhizobium altum]
MFDHAKIALWPAEAETHEVARIDGARRNVIAPAILREQDLKQGRDRFMPTPNAVLRAAVVSSEREAGS